MNMTLQQAFDTVKGDLSFLDRSKVDRKKLGTAVTDVTGGSTSTQRFELVIRVHDAVKGTQDVKSIYIDSPDLEWSVGPNGAILSSKRLDTRIDSVDAEIVNIKGLSRYAVNVGTNPTPADIQQAWDDLPNVPTLLPGATLINLDQDNPAGHAWTFLPSVHNPSGGWIDRGTDTVNKATNSATGVVMGSTDPDGIQVDNTGIMHFGSYQGIVDDIDAVNTKANNNKGEIDALMPRIASAEQSIIDNSSDIAANHQDIIANTVSIGQNSSAIAVNVTAIQTAMQGVAANTTLIQANTAAIGQNTTAINGLNTSLSALGGRVTTLETDNAKNKQDIATVTTLANTKQDKINIATSNVLMGNGAAGGTLTSKALTDFILKADTTALTDAAAVNTIMPITAATVFAHIQNIRNNLKSLFTDKAPIASPVFTGTPKVPNKTSAATADGTLIATEAQVKLVNDNAVLKTTDQTIAGVKTLNDPIVLNTGSSKYGIADNTSTGTYINGSKGIGASIAKRYSVNKESGYNTIFSSPSANGRWSVSTYQSSLKIGFEDADKITAGTNSLNLEHNFSEDGFLYLSKNHTLPLSANTQAVTVADLLMYLGQGSGNQVAMWDNTNKKWVAGNYTSGTSGLLITANLPYSSWNTWGEQFSTTTIGGIASFDTTASDAPWGSVRGIGSLIELKHLFINNNHRTQICILQYIATGGLYNSLKVWIRQINSSNTTWSAWKVWLA